MAKKEPTGWITVNGHHVPIYEGESKQDAYNRTIAKMNEDKKAADIAKRKEEVDKLNGKSNKSNESDYQKWTKATARHILDKFKGNMDKDVMKYLENTVNKYHKDNNLDFEPDAIMEDVEREISRQLKDDNAKYDKIADMALDGKTHIMKPSGEPFKVTEKGGKFTVQFDNNFDGAQTKWEFNNRQSVGKFLSQVNANGGYPLGYKEKDKALDIDKATSQEIRSNLKGALKDAIAKSKGKDIYDAISTISNKLDWGFAKPDLITLGKLALTGDKQMQNAVEELLINCNFNAENKLLHDAQKEKDPLTSKAYQKYIKALDDLFS